MAQTPENARRAFRDSVDKLVTDTDFDRITRFYYHTLGGDQLKAAGPPIQPSAPDPTVVSGFDTGLLSPYSAGEPKRQVYCDYQRRNNPNGAAGCTGSAPY